jgi:hypothetical protein
MRLTLRERHSLRHHARQPLVSEACDGLFDALGRFRSHSRRDKRQFVSPQCFGHMNNRQTFVLRGSSKGIFAALATSGSIPTKRMGIRYADPRAKKRLVSRVEAYLSVV